VFGVATLFGSNGVMLGMDYATLATKYVGDTAARYQQRRDQDSKWRAEDEAAAELLGRIAMGARALDVPVGTGRLLPFMNARAFDAYGLDISPDMLALANNRAAALGMKIKLGLGDIRDIPFDDDHFDFVSCLRFLNWVDHEGVTQAVRELARVSRDKLLLGVRYLPPVHEIKRHRWPLVRLGMRALGAPNHVERRTGLCFQHKSFISDLFETLGLQILVQRHIERRIDGTDYVFFLLRKT